VLNKGDNRPIGVFDSGVGGLTVMRALGERLPNERIVYVGDTARAPYGGLSAETLLSYSRDIVRFLLDKDVKVVVLACGTTSSTAYDALCAEYPDLPLVDVIRPGVAAVKRIEGWRDLRLGFIATAATIKKGLFVELLRREHPDSMIESRACPLFAPMAERGLFSSPVTKWAAEAYLNDWRDKIDALVLGCTHYPLLAGVLGEVLPSVKFLDLADETAKATAIRLDADGLLRSSSDLPAHEYYVSGPPEAFDAIAEKIQKKPCKAKKIVFK